MITVMCFFFLGSSDIEGPKEYCKNYNQWLKEQLHCIHNVKDPNQTGGNN